MLWDARNQDYNHSTCTQAVQQDPRVTQLVKDLSQSIQAAADDTGDSMPAVLVLNKVRPKRVRLHLCESVCELSSGCKSPFTFRPGSSQDQFRVSLGLRVPPSIELSMLWLKLSNNLVSSLKLSVG